MGGTLSKCEEHLDLKNEVEVKQKKVKTSNSKSDSQLETIRSSVDDKELINQMEEKLKVKES